MKKNIPKARFSRDFKIRSYEVGGGNKINILSYLNYLQETAGDHAEIMGVGFTQLLEDNRTWILAHYALEITGYPAWKDEIRVTTWPSGREKAYFLREFEVTGAKEDPLIRGTSAWIMLDLRRGRPIRPDQFLASFPIDRRRALEDDFTPVSFPKKEAGTERSLTVRADEVDLNGHVNHPYYIVWALENLPADDEPKDRPLRIRASFRHPAFRGQEITIRTAKKGKEPAYYHRIARKDDGRELARVATGWKTD